MAGAYYLLIILAYVCDRARAEALQAADTQKLLLALQLGYGWSWLKKLFHGKVHAGKLRICTNLVLLLWTIILWMSASAAKLMHPHDTNPHLL